jgi:hypothetical protein
VIIQDDQSSKPFQVQYGDQKWWYVAEALSRESTETIKSAARPPVNRFACVILCRSQGEGFSGLAPCPIFAKLLVAHAAEHAQSAAELQSAGHK